MKIEIEKKKADWRVLYCICLYFSEYCTVLTGRTVRWMSLITKRTIRYDIIQCTVWMYEVSTVHSVLYTFRKLDQSRNFGGRLAVIKFTVYYQCTLYSTVLYYSSSLSVDPLLWTAPANLHVADYSIWSTVLYFRIGWSLSKNSLPRRSLLYSRQSVCTGTTRRNTQVLTVESTVQYCKAKHTDILIWQFLVPYCAMRIIGNKAKHTDRQTDRTVPCTHTAQCA